MKIELRELQLRGSVRHPYLVEDAAQALLKLEADTEGLIYEDVWRSPAESMLARRLRKTSQLPGYSGHNFGLSFDLNVPAILEAKKIRYEDILYLCKRRGFYCHRRDGSGNHPESEHFNFLGEGAEEYLSKTTMDPITWQRPIEDRIFERHGSAFMISPTAAQNLLMDIGFFHGPATGENDALCREALMAFQRAWDLVEDGTFSMSTLRVLAFVTSGKLITPLKARSESDEGQKR